MLLKRIYILLLIFLAALVTMQARDCRMPDRSRPEWAKPDDTVSVADAFQPGSDLLFIGSFPNPFENTTEIKYSLSRPALVKIQVFDMRGFEVRSLESDTKNPGIYSISWDGTDNNSLRVETGIYFVKLSAGLSSEICKVVFIR